MKLNHFPEVVFVTVPPFTQSELYEQVLVADIAPVLELCIRGPTADIPQYHGYVKFKEPLNQPGSNWGAPRQEPPKEDLSMQLCFTKSKPSLRYDTVEFPMVECSVDIFDDRRLYFTADRNIINVLNLTFKNYISSTDGTRSN